MKMKKLMRMIAVVICLSMSIAIITPSAGVSEIQAATKIKLNYTKKTIYVGDTLCLRISGTSKKVTWSSSNKKVATVSSKGVIKGIKKGTAIITAKVNGKKYTCKVTVKENIKLNYSKVTINEGDTFVLKVTGTNSKVKWFSSDESVATVSSDGKVKGINGGKDNLSCEITALINGKSYTCNVTVKGSYLNVNELTFEEGETGKLWIIGNKQTVTWSSEDESIAMVSSDGIVEGKSAGKTNIIATTETKTYKCFVTITKKILVTGISIQDSLTMKVGQSITLVASPIPSNTTEKFVPTFLSKDTSVVRVTDGGSIIAYKSGQTQIVVSFKEIKKIVNITVEKTQSELIQEENDRYEKEKEALKNEYDTNYNYTNSQLTSLYSYGNYYLGSESRYQQELTEATQEVSKYQKIVNVYETDDSEEGRARLQKAKANLADAQQKLDNLIVQWANRERIDTLKTQLELLKNNYNAKLEEIKQIHDQIIANIKVQN